MSDKNGEINAKNIAMVKSSQSSSSSSSGEMKKNRMDWKWLVLVGAVWSRIVTTGTVVCMGAFFDSVQLSFSHISAFNLSMTFALATGLLEGMGFCVRLLITKFEARYLIFGGALVAAAGVIASSFTSNYIVLLLCFGFMNGIGQSMARFIMPTAVGYVFDARSRHVGLAIMNSGDGIGGVLAPVLLPWLINHFTWRKAMLITAAIVMNLCACAATVPKRLFLKKNDEMDGKDSKELLDDKKEQNPDANHRPSDKTNSSDDNDCVLFAEQHKISLFPNILFFYLNIVSHSIGYFIFMTFIYSDLASHDVDSSTISLVVSLIGGVSIIGRLGVSLLANWRYAPRWSIYAVCHVIRGLAVLSTLMAPSDSRGCAIWYAGVCAVYGLTDGITGALIAIVVVDLFGLSHFASVLGAEMMIMGAGAIVGVPLAGFLKDCFNGYTMPFVLSGCSFVFAGFILLPLLCTKKDYQLIRAKKSGAKIVELVEVRRKVTQ